MPKITHRVYWDSCVFLAYLNAETDRVDIIEAHWEEIASRGDARIMTAAISIVEVGHLTVEKAKKIILPDTTAKIDKMWHDPSVLVIEVHSEIMYIARDLMRTVTSRGWSLKPYDATHLAAAMWVQKNIGPISEFHTYDDKLPKLKDMVGFPIIEPPDIRKPKQLTLPQG